MNVNVLSKFLLCKLFVASWVANYANYLVNVDVSKIYQENTAVNYTSITLNCSQWPTAVCIWQSGQEYE